MDSLFSPCKDSRDPWFLTKLQGAHMKKLERSAVMRVAYNPLVCTAVGLSQIWGSSNLVQYSSVLLACQKLSMANTNCLSKLCCLGTFFAHFCTEINNLVLVQSVPCLINQPRSQYTWILAQEMINKQFSCHVASHRHLSKQKPPFMREKHKRAMKF